jgi:hypothetical protein
MKVAYSCVAAVGCTVASQFLYAVIERPSKVSVAPKIAVATDPVLLSSKSHSAKRATFGRTQKRSRWPRFQWRRRRSRTGWPKARPHGAAPLPCVLGCRLAESFEHEGMENFSEWTEEWSSKTGSFILTKKKARKVRVYYTWFHDHRQISFNISTGP